MWDFFAFDVASHLFLDTSTGVPNSICSFDRHYKSQWHLAATFPVPINSKSFGSAEQKVYALSVVNLGSKLRHHGGISHFLRQVLIVLPPVPIPFLVGLETGCSLELDVKLKERNGSHLIVSKWKASFPLSVFSHLWLAFESLSTEIDLNFDWSKLHKTALQPPMLSKTTSFINYHEDLKFIGYVSPPWEHDDYKSNFDTKDTVKLHERLPHPTNKSLIKLHWNWAFETNLKLQVKSKTILVSVNYYHGPSMPSFHEFQK